MLSRKLRIVDKPTVGTCLNLLEVSRVPPREGASLPFIESIDGGTGRSVQSSQWVCEVCLPQAKFKLVHHVDRQRSRYVKSFAKTFRKRVL